METNILPETSDEPNRGNKKLWSFIKRRKTDSVGVTLLKYKGTLWNKPKDKAEILNEQFKFVFSNRTPDEPDPLVTERDRPYPDIDELQIHQMVYQNYSKISIQINLWDLIKFI